MAVREVRETMWGHVDPAIIAQLQEDWDLDEGDFAEWEDDADID